MKNHSKTQTTGQKEENQSVTYKPKHYQLILRILIVIVVILAIMSGVYQYKIQPKHALVGKTFVGVAKVTNSDGTTASGNGSNVVMYLNKKPNFFVLRSDKSATEAVSDFNAYYKYTAKHPSLITYTINNGIITLKVNGSTNSLKIKKISNWGNRVEVTNTDEYNGKTMDVVMHRTGDERFDSNK
ncbi:hypothetical protein ABTQ33_12460 [Paucilactobacillus suebicus]|nr:hypothetical protein [Paucilactobacillus suebicus]